VRRWLRWLASGAVSMATPLPWLVDVTAARYDALEQRVTRLESERCLLTATASGSHAEVRYYGGGALASYTT
jgi:hypothetical protein